MKRTAYGQTPRSFFEEQRRNRRRTFLFLLVGLVWVASLGYWAIFLQFVLVSGFYRLLETPIPGFFSAEEAVRWASRGAGAFVLFWSAIAFVLYWCSSSALPKLVGAIEPSGPEGRRLRQILDLVLRGAGEETGATRIFLWPTTGANAFAAGRNLAQGSVVVSSGLVACVNDDELTAVIAHEVGHLKNRDTVYIVQAVALVAVVLTVAYIGAGVATLIAGLTLALCAVVLGIASEIEDDSGCGLLIALLIAGSILLFGLRFLLVCLAVFGAVTLVVGLGMKCAASAISQSREYLADACAAQWTRNSAALASALRKVSSNQAPLPIRAALLQPLLLHEPGRSPGRLGVRHTFDLLLRTHPRVEARIAVLEQMVGGNRTLNPRESTFRLWVEWTVPLLISAALAAASIWLIPRAPLAFESLLLRPATANSSIASTHVGWIKGSSVRVRSEPSIVAPIVGRLSRGDEVEILDYTTGSGSERGWYRIRTPNLSGWVAMRLVSQQTSR